MTPTPAAICKRRPHLHLSASILFTPKELRQYLRFRRSTILHLSDSEMNRIPIASEYADFLAWKEKQRTRESHHDLFNPCRSFGDLSAHISSVNETSSASNDGALSLSFAVAKRCGHILHPGTPYPHASATKQLHVERCPVCTVDMHVTYMALLFKALNANGGPFRPRDAPDSQHEAVFQAWNAGKLNLVQTIYHYEKYAKHEEDFRRCMYTNLTAWESNSAEEYLQRTYSAKAALNIYHEQVLELKPDFEAEITQQNIEKSSRKCGKRRVNFREGTCFDPSRCHAYFYRKSPRFDGKYLRQRIHEDKATESESDIETPTIIGGNTESNCSDIEGSILGRCLDSDASQESESAICRDVQHDTMSSALNISFESSTSSSDTTVRGSSEDPDSASESDTDVEGMDVEDRVESILFGCASADDDPRDEEDGTEENEDSSDEDSSGSEGEWDEEDDDFGGDFIIFG